jgi:hypothetical protein
MCAERRRCDDPHCPICRPTDPPTQGGDAHAHALVSGHDLHRTDDGTHVTGPATDAPTAVAGPTLQQAIHAAFETLDRQWDQRAQAARHEIERLRDVLRCAYDVLHACRDPWYSADDHIDQDESYRPCPACARQLEEASEKACEMANLIDAVLHPSGFDPAVTAWIDSTQMGLGGETQ